MIFQIDLTGAAEFSRESHLRKVLYEAPGTKALLICFEAGQAVLPCVMDSLVYFVVLEGTGRLVAGTESRELKAGVMVVVPPGLERKIEAGSRLVILAVQVHRDV